MQVKVSAADARKFSNVWTHQGVTIVMTDVHLQFAADFATVALKSFVEEVQKAADARAAQASLPTVTLE